MQEELIQAAEMARQLCHRLEAVAEVARENESNPNLATDVFTAFGASFDLSYELRKLWLGLTSLPVEDEDESPDAIISGPMVGGPMAGWNQRTQTWDSVPVENPFHEGECDACGRVAMLGHGLCEGCTIEGMME